MPDEDLSVAGSIYTVWRKTPTLSWLIETLMQLTVTMFAGLIIANPDQPWWMRAAAAVMVAILGIQLVLRLARFAARAHTSEVIKIERELAYSAHPDGCMCPVCIDHRKSNGEPADPHSD